MGLIVPEDLDLSTLANAAERTVVEALRDGLPDSWLVLPHVGLFTERRDHELDVVLVHGDHGVVDVEVKGHRVQVRDGRWCGADGRALSPQPFDQARKNAYALRDELRDVGPGLERLAVDYAVALPNTVGFEGQLPPDHVRAQVLTADELGSIADAILDLVSARSRVRSLTPAQVEAIVRHLRPDVEFRWDPNAQMDLARARLDEACASQTRALERLDGNRRVVALGLAGTGKTRLASAWAKRAYLRDERVLFTCYNEPLAQRLAEAVPEDETLKVGPFLKVALGLEGMPPLPVPAEADNRWWTIDAVGHLVSHWHEVTERFDTIVIDEAQDFSPAWLALLETLLDPEGPRRLLWCADQNQELYPRGFHVPGTDDGWTRCELVTNCRNAHGIASLMRMHLGGAASPVVGPEAVDLRWVGVPEGDPVAVEAVVGGELGRLIDDEERDPTRLAVLTFSSALRDRLVEAHGLVRWERRGEIGPDGSATALVENVHRVKGLEFDTVVLVADRAEVADDLLYVGVGRAVNELVLISPEPLALRLRLA